jgi:hypothetical protein
VRAALVAEGKQVEIRGETAGWFLFERRGDRVGWTGAPGVTGGNVDRPALAPRALDGLLAELERALVDQGLYPREARAMVTTWRDQWFVDGLRLLYLVPRGVTDRVLPLRVAPAPDELQRVLVGRIEIITPETELSVRELLGSEPNDERAIDTLRSRFGRFAQPVLTTARARAADAALAARIDRLVPRL